MPSCAGTSTFHFDAKKSLRCRGHIYCRLNYAAQDVAAISKNYAAYKIKTQNINKFAAYRIKRQSANESFDSNEMAATA